jgi:hypothetical protein
MSRTEREKEFFFKKKYIYIYIKLLRNIKKKIVLNYLFQNDTLNNIPASKTGGWETKGRGSLSERERERARAQCGNGGVILLYKSSSFNGTPKSYTF